MVAGGKPVISGTVKVAPNIATTCCTPTPTVRGQDSRSSGCDHVAGADRPAVAVQAPRGPVGARWGGGLGHGAPFASSGDGGVIDPESCFYHDAGRRPGAAGRNGDPVLILLWLEAAPTVDDLRGWGRRAADFRAS